MSHISVPVEVNSPILLALSSRRRFMQVEGSMDKAAAEKLVVTEWRALPANQRKTIDQALAFAERIGTQVAFDTLGNSRSIVRAWVVREFQGGADLNKAIRTLKDGA